MLLQLKRFIIVGVLSTATTYLFLVILVESFDTNPVKASVIGYIAAGVLNYLLNRNYTFQSGRSHRSAGPRHAVVILAGLLLNTLVMHAGVQLMGIHYAITQFIAICLVFSVSFTLGRTWTFSS